MKSRKFSLAALWLWTLSAWFTSLAGQINCLGKLMLFCTGWGATNCLIIIASPHIFYHLSLSVLLISPPYSRLEEMKDHVESSEKPDSILTDSIQSKGKGVGGSTRTRSLPRSYLAHVSIYKRILISGRSCWIKIHFIRRILSAVQPSVTQLHLPCLRFFPPVCLHLLPSVGAGRRFVRAPPGPNAFVNPLYPFQVHSYDPDILV